MALKTSPNLVREQVTLLRYDCNEMIDEAAVLKPNKTEEMNLTALAQHFQLEKGSAKLLFTPVYERYLKHSRTLSFSVLEFGVGNASSLKMWASYFAKGAVYGIAEHPTMSKFCKNYHNITIAVGNPNQEDSMPKNFEHQFDLIIDEASHSMGSVVAPLKTLWPQLKRGGLYVIEDPIGSFLKIGEKPQKLSPLSFASWFRKEQPHPFEGFIREKLQHMEDPTSDIDFIHLYPHLCLFRKK